MQSLRELAIDEVVIADMPILSIFSYEDVIQMIGFTVYHIGIYSNIGNIGTEDVCR